MSRRVLPTIILMLFVLAGGVCSIAFAQGQYDQPVGDDSPAPLPNSYDTPPVITVVDGTARLIRQGQAETAAVNMPLVEGDRVVTDEGRVEVRFADGSWLHMDRATSVDFLSLSLMRLLDGRVIFGAAGRGGERPTRTYQIDAAAGSVQVQLVGEYHVSTYADGTVAEVELAVTSGDATLMNERGNVEVQAGQRSWAREGLGPQFAQTFNSARLDDFDQWSEAQLGQEVGVQSAQYLPSDLSYYSGEFDRDGRWENVQPYGQVWFPRVAVGWRPYYDGYWDWVGPYGWTWIGYSRWSWATHHFGRWGIRAGLWFWIPGRHWAPAWVSWAFAPGYMSWCPLDYYNRPVVNIFIGGYRRYGYRDPWHAWTVVPRHSFGPRLRVANYALSGGRLPSAERTRFAVARGTPDPPRAVTRSVAGGGLRAAPLATSRATAPRALSSTTPSGYARAQASRGNFPLPRAQSRSALSRGDVRPGASSPGYERPSAASPNRAMPRGYDRPSTSSPGYERPSAASPNRAMPRGYDRPSASSPGYDRPSAASPNRAMPRGYDRPSASSPGYDRPSAASPNRAMPRGYDRPSQYPGIEVHRGTPPSYSAPTYSPRYSAPPSRPDYSPRYSVPRSGPDYSSRPPSYSAPRSAPSYGAPAAPRGYDRPSGMPSAPRGYSAPPPSRGPGPGAAAPSRGPSGGAPTRGGGQSAPSGQAQPRGGRGR